jgi:hypothetical protein
VIFLAPKSPLMVATMTISKVREMAWSVSLGCGLGVEILALKHLVGWLALGKMGENNSHFGLATKLHSALS